MDNVIIISEISKYPVYFYMVLFKMIYVLGEICASPSAIDYTSTDWKPLLLIVPLRLGLSEMNVIYVEGLKVDFYKQSSNLQFQYVIFLEMFSF